MKKKNNNNTMEEQKFVSVSVILEMLTNTGLELPGAWSRVDSAYVMRESSSSEDHVSPLLQ